MKTPVQKETLFGGLPVTVSGIVFWGMVLVGLLAIVVVSNDKERQLDEHIRYGALLVTSEIEEIIEHNPRAPVLEQNREAIKRTVTGLLATVDVSAVSLHVGDQDLLIGTPGENDDFQYRTIIYHDLATAELSTPIAAKIYFPNREETITELRNELFVTIGLGVFVAR